MCVIVGESWDLNKNIVYEHLRVVVEKPSGYFSKDLTSQSSETYAFWTVLLLERKWRDRGVLTTDLQTRRLLVALFVFLFTLAQVPVALLS